MSGEKFPIFSSDNFNNWIFRLEFVLDEKRVAHVLKDDVDKTQNNYEQSNAKAKNIILQCLPDKYLNLVKGISSANEIIKSLKVTFQRKSIISIIQLKRKLLNLKQSTNESLEDYFNKFDLIVRELECAQETLTDKDKVACLLTGLDSRYTVITAIECNTGFKAKCESYSLAKGSVPPRDSGPYLQLLKFTEYTWQDISDLVLLRVQLKINSLRITI